MNFMDLKMTINEIEEKLFNYIEYRCYLNGNRAFCVHYDLGTVLENPEGVYLIGSCFLSDRAKGTELREFLSFFNYIKVLTFSTGFDTGDEELAYIYKLHGFTDDIR